MCQSCWWLINFHSFEAHLGVGGYLRPLSTPKIIDPLCLFTCYLLYFAKREEALIRKVVGEGVGCWDDSAPSRGMS